MKTSSAAILLAAIVGAYLVAEAQAEKYITNSLICKDSYLHGDGVLQGGSQGICEGCCLREKYEMGYQPEADCICQRKGTKLVNKGDKLQETNYESVENEIHDEKLV